MDVKFKQADWEQMNSGLRDLIGLGRWGKGAIDDLKDLSKLMDKVESDLSKFDSDGVISLAHRNQESKYQDLFEDFKVLTEFSKDVGKVVNETIDEPFHKEIDSFVEKMRDASISHYTTDNRIGATDTIISYYGGYRQEHVIEKKEIGLEDLFNGDNFYAEQMKLEYELWQGQVSNEEITYEDYQLAAVNMNAFEYSSIKDSQITKEFWVSIAATVVIIGAAIICPPAGLALGVAYGTLELSSAVSGTDWVSGREIDTGERLLRGGLAPLDIIPGVSAVKRFSTVARTVNVGSDLAQAGTRTALTARLTSSAQQQMRTVQDVVVTAGKQADARLRSAGQFLKDQGANAVTRVADSVTDMARLGDKGLTSMKNAIPQNGLALDGIGASARIPAENIHTLENATSGLANWMKSSVGKVDGVGSGVGSKGTVKGKGVSETNLRNIDDFIKGNKKFDEVIEDYAKVYKEHVDLNKPWSWDDTIPVGDSLSSAQKRKIKEMAIEKGHIPEIKVTKADGMRYGFADFASAGVVEETVQLPEKFWRFSDKEQFKWLDEQIGGTRKGMTWHHTEIPGKMELVPFGIHNITPHNGGRTKGMWADAPR
ncbi:HNH endonuclease signature motif containing protein [Alkalihalobacillus hemicellulosilyticus]|uniref:Membrane spanning protein n=1 Tax=Halalkalibacter hemicellulosilyticusJCM 9152 TaxID=1236971 RepID=W4QCX0_9BACI|nr:HNH endonuclease [Halalkalibacter hemicellulosilyticus]GAE29513.1 membrane spanning protein [Halalkalibacter hemicellulosilyticusJCM 9152]